MVFKDIISAIFKVIVLIVPLMFMTNVKAEYTLDECRLIPIDELAYMEKDELIELACMSTYGVKLMASDPSLWDGLYECHKANLKRVQLVLKKDHGVIHKGMESCK